MTSVHIPPSYPAEQDTARSDQASDTEHDEGGMSSSYKHEQSESDNSHRIPGKPLPNEESDEQSKDTLNNKQPEKRTRSVLFDDDTEEHRKSDSKVESASITPHRDEENVNQNNSTQQVYKAHDFHSDDEDEPNVSKPSIPRAQAPKEEKSDEQESVTSTLSEGGSETNSNHDQSGEQKPDAETHKNEESQNEERVLVEINGKFELLSVSECQAMGLPIPEELMSESGEQAFSSFFLLLICVRSLTTMNISVAGSTQSDTYNNYSRKPRPKSSVGSSEREQQPTHTNRPQARAQSAGTARPYSRKADWDMSGYISPYGLTKEQKEHKEQREKLIKERFAFSNHCYIRLVSTNKYSAINTTDSIDIPQLHNYPIHCNYAMTDRFYLLNLYIIDKHAGNYAEYSA